MKFFTTATGLAFAGLMLPTAVSAATLNASELLTQFTLISKGDVYSTSEVEGRILVGGDLSGNMNTNFNLGLGGGVPASDYDEAIVLGDVSGLLRVQNGGDASVGSVSGYTDLQGGGVLTTGTVAHPENFGSILDLFSSDLAGTTGQAATLQGQTLKFSADADQDITMFSVDWTDLYSNNGVNISGFDYDFGANSDGVMIINVSGTSGAFANNNETKSLGRQVIWNFYEAESFVLDRAWIGSILAPNADVTVRTPYEGTLFANNVRMESEGHRQVFVGVPMDEPSVVPLPAAFGLFGSALAAFGLFGYRRKA